MTTKPAKPSRLIRGIQERCSELADITKQREAMRDVQLPLWYDEQRGTPNSFLRSALFAAIQSKDRVYLESVTVASQQGITVKFTGRQLNQEDLTVWQTLVHLLRMQPLGNECRFTGYSLLKMMDLPKSADHYARLKLSIERLTACLVKIEGRRYTYGGSLIHSFVIDEQTTLFKVQLNRDLIDMFWEDDWTALQWKQRLLLRRKPLAQSLHAYYSSHKYPKPVGLKFLQEITGSRNTQSAGFKRHCRAALEELVTVSFLESYSIEGELVTVKRTYRSAGQQYLPLDS
jgi:hypothetical protein